MLSRFVFLVWPGLIMHVDDCLDNFKQQFSTLD